LTPRGPAIRDDRFGRSAIRALDGGVPSPEDRRWSMSSYLVVANQTLTGPALIAELRARLAGGPAHFHVVVPATPVVHRLTWDEQETRAAAEDRLAGVVATIRELGGTAEGEIGVSDPIDAVRDALRNRTADGVILSTLPAGHSRWLGQDVPSRLRAAVDVPVAVVTAAAETADVQTG
jgi:hypothetical protein